MRDDLRAAVELALAVGRADHDADPPVPPPSALRPFFTFTKLPTAARKTAIAAIDSDEPFRLRVGAKATEKSVGRVGWLWLNRPQGWEEEVEAIRGAAQADQGRREDERDEQRAVRRLRKMEDRAERAERAVESLRVDVESERTASAALRVEREESQELHSELEAQAAEAADERTRILRQFKAAEARAAALLDEKRAVETQVRRLENELAEVRASAEFGAALNVDSTDSTRSATHPVGSGVFAADQTPDEPTVDLARLDQLAEELADAAGVAERLAESLSDAAAGARRGVARPSNGFSTGSWSSSQRSRREPEPLPVGVFDDSVDAANHLVRVPNMVALVDGYNVSMGAWPRLSIADQRRRLIDGLDALSARTRLNVDLVFDGVREPHDIVGHSGPRLLTVLYTEVGVEADDLILDRIGTYPATQPIVVVSSDRRVSDGSRAQGVNVLESALLAELITGS